MRRSAAQVFLGNAASKALGLLREIITAALFGTGSVVASFRVALAGTFFPVNFLTSDALNAAFIPLFRHLSRESKDRAQLLVWFVLGLFALVALALGLFLGLAASQWVHVLAPGLDAQTADLTSAVLETMSLGVPLYLMSAVLMYVAMANGDFAPISYRPVIQNLGLIVGTLAAYSFHEPVLFAWGFTISYALICAWSLLRETRAGYLTLPECGTGRQLKETMTSFWAILRPLLPLPFLLQGTLVVERVVASLIGVVAVSALDYARFGSETLITVVSVPIASAGLVEWSGLGISETRVHLRKVIPLVLLIAVPISSLIAGNTSLLVRVTFARGAFNAQSVTVTAAILFGISLGLWAQVLGYVLMRALSAQRRNRTVLAIMLCSLGANVAFDLLAYRSLGAATLGIGNAVYGMGILGGSLTALGLWRDFLLHANTILIGGATYSVISRYVTPHDTGVWLSFGEVCLISLSFWSIWVLAIPGLRRVVWGVVRRGGRGLA